MDILVIGQSNASNWFHDSTVSASHPSTLSWRGGGWNPVRGEGAVTFSATLANATGEQIRLLNAAEGNTSLTPVQGANWLATGPTSLYGKALAAVAASGLKPDAIIWIQGERDAQFRVGTDAYRAGLETLYQRLQADFGDVPLLMQPLVLPQTGMEAIVAAQQAFAAAHADDVTLVTPSVDAPARDLLHFTPGGYNVLADLMARAVLAELSLPGAPPIIYGTATADRLAGNDGANRIYAGAGDDVLDGRGGSDLLLGGAGADRFVFSSAPDGDRVLDFTSGVDKLVFGSLEGITVSGGNVYKNGQLAVSVQGTIAPGDIVNEAAPPPPPPRPAHAHLVGTARSDTLIGGTGNDTLDGGAGSDSLAGGLGDDTYIVTSGDRLADSGGLDHVMSSTSWTLATGFEHLTLTGTASISGTGNTLHNRIVGNSGNNRISAGAGNDTIIGSAGRDTLDGGAGFDIVDFSAGRSAVVNLAAMSNMEAAIGSGFADRITGSTAANRLEGGAGNDTLAGGRGNDTVIGGLGSDAFEFRESGADRIADFTAGADRIWIDDGAFSRIGARGNFGAADGRFWAAHGAVRGHDGNDRVIYDLSTGNLYYDADGSGRGASILIATLEGAPGLSASDITVI